MTELAPPLSLFLPLIACLFCLGLRLFRLLPTFLPAAKLTGQGTESVVLLVVVVVVGVTTFISLP